MKIKGVDILQNRPVTLTAYFTNEHPASHYGQPVMVVEEWKDQDVMSHENWILCRFKVTTFDNAAEEAAFEKWFSLIKLMAGSPDGFY